MKKGKYEKLQDTYPECISKVQLYEICRISPRTAQYLLEHRIIPSIDTGEKTWRYKIALTDVIEYLRRREQVGSMIPSGSVSSERKRPNNPRKPYCAYISQGLGDKMAQYFKYIYTDYPDALSATNVAEMTGLSKETILRYLKNGKIKSLEIGAGNKYIIPKQYVLEFAVSPAFIDCKSNSEVFIKVLGGFEIWKNAE